uniref:DED domain-containing protein n=1 Tax=Knipowitschia caucasica TaxID=637954 RepID=A0AAV2MC98_KNICA
MRGVISHGELWLAHISAELSLRICHICQNIRIFNSDFTGKRGTLDSGGERRQSVEKNRFSLDYHCWEDNECLNYYGLLSLHEAGQWNPVRMILMMLACPLVLSCGLELLLELENRGYISEGNLEPLLQLLRVLTRHDLLPFVSHKKRRTVSPERIRHWRAEEQRELLICSGMPQTCRTSEIPLSSFTQQGRSGMYSPVPDAPARKRRRRGNGWSRKPKKTIKPSQPQPLPAPQSVSCG